MVSTGILPPRRETGNKSFYFAFSTMSISTGSSTASFLEGNNNVFLF